MRYNGFRVQPMEEPDLPENHKHVLAFQPDPEDAPYLVAETWEEAEQEMEVMGPQCHICGSHGSGGEVTEYHVHGTRVVCEGCGHAYVIGRCKAGFVCF